MIFNNRTMVQHAPQENDIFKKENTLSNEYIHQKIQEIMESLTNKTRPPELVCEVKIIDFNDPEVQESMKKCREAQEEILNRKKIDWKVLNEQITI